MPNVQPIVHGSGDANPIRNLPLGARERWENQMDIQLAEIGWKDLADAANGNGVFCIDENNRPQLISNVAESFTRNKLMLAGAEGRLFVRPKNGEGLVQFQTTLSDPVVEAPDAYDDIVLTSRDPQVHENALHRQEFKEVGRLQVQKTEPLRELPLVQVERPPFWKYLLFPFFMDDLVKYHSSVARNEAFVSSGLSDAFRNGFAATVQAAQDAKAQETAQITETVRSDRKIEQTLETCRAYAEGERVLDPDAELGDNEDAMDGLDMIRDAHQRGMQEKLELMQDIINGRPLASSREELMGRLGRIMMAEDLMDSVQRHIVDCKQRGVQEINPLYEAVGGEPDAFELMEGKMAESETVYQMAIMAPNDLLKLLSNPVEMSRKVSAINVENGGSRDMEAQQDDLEMGEQEMEMDGPKEQVLF